MWEMGNGWSDGRSSAQMASYHAMMHEIHVLLVDHDSEALISTAKLLEICQYRVTFVELASAAISMLLSGKAKFDAVIANINSPDLHGFKLLQHAVNMGLPVVLMSSEDNAFMAMRALENGAFLYIKKPATIEILKCLWQHVLREKTRAIRERDMLVAANNNNNNNSNGHANRGVEIAHNNNREENPDYYNAGKLNGYVMNKNNKGKCKKKIRGGREGADDDDEGDSDNYRGAMENNNNNNVKRKMCTEWTQELHAKFMDAVEQLGEGRCFPKEILELMNVPGLTRMQVASHLQKCRNDNWRSPLERKSSQINQPAPLDINGSQQRPRRFGSKPQLGKTQSGQVQSSQGRSETHSDSGTPRNDGRGNNNNVTGYGSSSAVPDPAVVRPGPHSSPNPNEYFNFPNVDSLMHNISGLPQGSAVNTPNPAAPGAFNFDPAYNDRNSAGPSMDTKSNWSSETSNFEE